MKLITPEFERLFQDFSFGSQQNVADPLVVAKLFDIAGSATWYLIEYSPKEKNAFGYVQGLVPGDWNDEWGYIHIPELEEIKHPLFNIPRIERDLYFTQRPISEYVPALKKAA